MIVRSLDSSGDWNFGRGKSDYLTGNDAIAQSVKTKVLSFLNDCFFAPDDGIDWFYFLGAKNITGLELKIRETILSVKGVTKLLSVTTGLDETRKLTVSYTIETTTTIIEATAPIEETFILSTESGYGLETEDGGLIQV